MNHKDSARPTRHVLLYAYQRPKLTIQACESVLSWSELQRLVITIDGLRPTASEDEVTWRNETIQVSQQLANDYENIEVKVWDTNIGLTEHIFRSIAYVLKSADSLIAIEDDNLISVQGLNFLSSRVDNSESPKIAAGFNKFLHFDYQFPQLYRSTLFPVQWTTALNKSMFAIVEDVWSKREIELSVVQNRIHSLKGMSFLKRKRLISYWYKYFCTSMESPRHTDIVVQYAVFKAGIFYEVPLGDFVDDLANLDWRGMNTRHNPIIRQVHRPRIYITPQGDACAVCDLLGSRIEPSMWRQFKTSIRLRLFGVLSAPKRLTAQK
ncbi:hypothetical protein MCEMRE212_00026 [Candidatus Nanopelagicaceae bacterium]